jgi:hypothetical protein
MDMIAPEFGQHTIREYFYEVNEAEHG